VTDRRTDGQTDRRTVARKNVFSSRPNSLSLMSDWRSSAGRLFHGTVCLVCSSVTTSHCCTYCLIWFLC